MYYPKRKVLNLKKRTILQPKKKKKKKSRSLTSLKKTREKEAQKQKQNAKKPMHLIVRYVNSAPSYMGPERVFCPSVYCY